MTKPDMLAELAEVVRLPDFSEGDTTSCIASLQFLRDNHAELEAMARDAKRGKWIIKHAEWIRDEDDTLMAIRFPGKHVNLESVGMRTDAIDDAMRAENRHD